jgi:hypothetical protein
MRGDASAMIPPDSDVLVALRTWSIALNENHRADLPREMSRSVSNMRYLHDSPFVGIGHFSSSSTRSSLWAQTYGARAFGRFAHEQMVRRQPIYLKKLRLTVFFVQDYCEKRVIHFNFDVIFDEAQLPELVHEHFYPRARRTDHSR